MCCGGRGRQTSRLRRGRFRWSRGIRSGRLRWIMAADLVATEGNSLEDIEAVRKVAFVMKAGSVSGEGGSYNAPGRNCFSAEPARIGISLAAATLSPVTTVFGGGRAESFPRCSVHEITRQVSRGAWRRVGSRPPPFPYGLCSPRTAMKQRWDMRFRLSRCGVGARPAHPVSRGAAEPRIPFTG
jgi:hypothetical protein